jgi:hypothetical protein
MGGLLVSRSASGHHQSGASTLAAALCRFPDYAAAIKPKSPKTRRMRGAVAHIACRMRHSPEAWVRVA